MRFRRRRSSKLMPPFVRVTASAALRAAHPLPSSCAAPAARRHRTRKAPPIFLRSLAKIHGDGWELGVVGEEEFNKREIEVARGHRRHASASSPPTADGSGGSLGSTSTKAVLSRCSRGYATPMHLSSSSRSGSDRSPPLAPCVRSKWRSPALRHPPLPPVTGKTGGAQITDELNGAGGQACQVLQGNKFTGSVPSVNGLQSGCVF